LSQTSSQPKSRRRARCAFQILCLLFPLSSTRKTPSFSSTTPSYSRHSTTSQPQFPPNLQKSTTLTTSRSLCYIPFGVGCMCAALTNGQFLDRNFARWCRKLGAEIRKGFEQDLRNFPVEKARLEVAFPACYIAVPLVLVFGWILDVNGPLPAALIVLFLSSFSMSVAFNVTGTLLVDFYPEAPATATAANNLVRCLLKVIHSSLSRIAKSEALALLCALRYDASFVAHATTLHGIISRLPSGTHHNSFH
jgi:hypothetical protein